MIYFSSVFDNVFSSWHIFFVHKNNISSSYPTGVYLFKVNKKNIKAMCEVYLMLTIQIPEWRQWRHSGFSRGVTKNFRKMTFQKSWEKCNWCSLPKAVDVLEGSVRSWGTVKLLMWSRVEALETSAI